MAFLFSEDKIDLSGKTLIIPVVSTANISQLATDLIISSLSLKSQAIVDPSYFIPAVGSREDGIPGLVTPLELYSSKDATLAIFQQRSPVLKSRKSEYIPELLRFIEDSQPAAVLFLTGVDMSNRIDSQMNTPTYQLITQAKGSTPLLKNLNELPIPIYSSSSNQYPDIPNKDPLQVPFIPGGGLTRKMLAYIPGNWTIPTATLLHFVLEGDNRGDAQLFAAVVSKVLDLDIQQWVLPESWKYGLFGQSHDQSLYG